MVHVQYLNMHDEELDTISEIQRPPIRSYIRKERIHGLLHNGIDQIASTPSESKVNGEYFSSYKSHDDYHRNESTSTRSQPTKRIRSRRSLASLFSKSSESQTNTSSAWPSFASQSNSASQSSQNPLSFTRSPSPAPRHHRSPLTSKSSLTKQAASPLTSTTDVISPESSAEDISTYHANLARFRAERAEHVAELGLAKLNLRDPLSSSSHDRVVDRTGTAPKADRPASRGQQDGGKRSSGRSLGLGRGLRMYWGGGEHSGGSDVRCAEVVDTAESRDVDLGLDGAMDRQALKEWWDKLGTQ